MTTIEATFTGGAFVPTEPFPIQEGSQVELTIKSTDKKRKRGNWDGFDFEEWSKRTEALRQSIFERVGFLPDSALQVAEDRRRDD